MYFNQEVAPAHAPDHEQPTEQLPMEARLTPGVVGVAQLARELGVPVERTVKTMLYVIDGTW
jgi:prolyl-tRNA editing enzyme YbaK/EbsC (Cys-tRNA(Pro) deacylase)